MNNSPISYRVSIRNISDYSPFGVQLDGRTVSSDSYRYGFQGKEGDSEIKGEGNSYTTEFRQYDPRIGRWMSLDPRKTKYPNISPYVSFGNNPIVYNDIDGDTIFVAGTLKQQRKTVAYLQTLTNDKLVISKGKVLIKSHDNVNCDKYLETGTSLIRELIYENNKLTIFQNITSDNFASSSSGQYRGDRINGVGTDTEVHFDYTHLRTYLTEDPSTKNSILAEAPSQITLGHELTHAYYMMKGTFIDDKITESYKYKNQSGEIIDVSNVRKEETETVGLTGDRKYSENKIRKEQGFKKRIKY